MAPKEDPGPRPERQPASRPEDAASGRAEAGIAALAARGPTPEAAGGSSALRAGVEALQRSAGNRATSALILGRATLQRLKGEGDAAVDPVAAVHKALVDGNESEAHRLMGTLTSAAQANKVLQDYQGLAVKCFGNATMGTAAKILVAKGGSLGLALNWMVDEGTSWSLMEPVVKAASPAERNKVRGEEWMKWWGGRLGNTDMAALVKVLPLDLPTKLKWMEYEGSNWGLMKGVIESVPAAQRTTVVEHDSLRGFFVSECNDAEMYQAVKLLGGKLVQQLDWMVEEDCKDAWITERIKAVKDEKQRLALYHHKPVWNRLRKMSYEDRAATAKLLGGTPDEQLSLFQNDVSITRLDWATPSADWVAAIMKYRKSPLDMLQLATRDPLGWAPLIRPQLWNLLKDFHNVIHPEERMKPFWEAFGNGSTFNATQIMHFITVLTGKQPYPRKVTSAPGKVPGEVIAGGHYFARMPDDATAREFMEILKPGGSSGVRGISREELAIGKLAFCSHEKDSAGNWKLIETSYFWDPWIIIKVDPSGARDSSLVDTTATLGLPRGVGVGLSWFQNHVRHEIGHAVGARKIGGMTESGNDFAKRYASWKKSSQSRFEAALWRNVPKPAAGWPSVPILGTPVTLTNQDVHDWCVDVIARGREPTNAIGSAAGDLQQKLAAISGSLWGGVELVKYMRAIAARNPGDMRNNAYEFAGFTPPDPVQIFATRWDNDFVEYSKDAHDALKNISWYALSSPPEMFAEMYTARYLRQRVPVKVGSADPAVFFRTLEGQRDRMFGSS